MIDIKSFVSFVGISIACFRLLCSFGEFVSKQLQALLHMQKHAYVLDATIFAAVVFASLKLMETVYNNWYKDSDEEVNP